MEDASNTIPTCPSNENVVEPSLPRPITATEDTRQHRLLLDNQLLVICPECFKLDPKLRPRTIKQISKPFEIKCPRSHLHNKIRKIFKRLFYEKRRAEHDHSTGDGKENSDVRKNNKYSPEDDEYVKRLKEAAEELFWKCPFPSKFDFEPLKEKFECRRKRALFYTNFNRKLNDMHDLASSKIHAVCDRYPEGYDANKIVEEAKLAFSSNEVALHFTQKVIEAYSETKNILRSSKN